MRLVPLLASVWAVAIVAVWPSNAAYSRCDSSPLATMDYELLRRLSPFTILRSTRKYHNCITVVYTPGECGQPNATGTAYVIRPDCMYSYSLQQIDDNRQWMFTVSNTNRSTNYRSIYANFNGTSAAFCIVECTPDGIHYDELICLGRTDKDEAGIQKFLDTQLQDVPDIRNTTKECT